MIIADLVAKVQQYDPSLDGAGWSASTRSPTTTRGATPRLGESYIAHPLAVGDILADLEMDRATIAAALLHDVVETPSSPTSRSPRSSAPRSPPWSTV